jgi:hypothetical protein
MTRDKGFVDFKTDFSITRWPVTSRIDSDSISASATDAGWRFATIRAVRS